MLDKVTDHEMIINADACSKIPKRGCRTIQSEWAVIRTCTKIAVPTKAYMFVSST
jgi:hypothetical protein